MEENVINSNKNSTNIDINHHYLNTLCILFKCCDFCHMLYDYNLYNKWVLLLQEEFYRQGDIEKKIFKETSILFDRNLNNGVYNHQICFIDNVVSPLFYSVCKIFPRLNYLHNNLILLKYKVHD